MKKHLGFILFFSTVIFIFLGKLMLMKASMFGGDYLQQFYPWSKAYSEAIKSFTFPFWIRYVNSGFPLMAEGQIGGFYPLNIIMFFLLPFNVAYNYSIILHFILAGIFTYIYARKIGSDQWGAALSVLVFCFGSSYAGCFYNMITLRTLAWFPFALFIIEKYFDAKKIQYVLCLGVVLGVQLLAGFAQMAVYSAVFYVIYFFYGLWIRNKFKANDVVKIGSAFLVAAAIFLPQLLLSLKMVNLSTRTESSLSFALWGSFNPLNLINLYFPKIIISGSQFYIGVPTLIFFIFAIRARKREIRIKPVFLILAVSFLLALGAHNPLYVLFLKITHLYGFRNPSKFIFFSVFAAAILSGWGFTQLFGVKNIKENNKALRTTIYLTGISTAIFILAAVIIRLFKEKIMQIGKWYIANHIFGKEYHRHSFEMYLYKLEVFYQKLTDATSFSNIFVLFSLLLCIFTILLSVYLIKKQEFNNILKKVFILAIFLDIFVFSFYGIGFRGNIQRFHYLKPTHNEILEALQSDKDFFRILPYWYENGNMPWWVRPSANILVGLDSIASYSPLVQKSYEEEIGALGVVDSSLGVPYPQPDVIKEKYDLLRLLNVKYIISAHALKFDFLRELVFERGVYLYEFKDYLPRIFFTYDISDSLIKAEKIPHLEILIYKDGFLKVRISSETAGFLVFSENYYPGWIAYIDGKITPIIKVKNIIQAIKARPGEHIIVFEYRPCRLSER